MGRFAGTGFLNKLARLYGVQTAYYDVHHRRRQASPESLLAILRSLGAPRDNPSRCASGLARTAAGTVAEMAGAGNCRLGWRTRR